jgi:uncharacterized membrane protein YphA (DoxX/SURF4 family)
MNLSKTLRIIDWIVRIVVAIVLLQTLFFKFTGARESVYIFSTLGAEPWGRVGSGVVELVAAILLLIPRTAVYGAILALGTIAGAIFAHLTKLGIAVSAVDDHGELFALAMVVFIGSLVVLYIRRSEIPVIGPKLVSPIHN